MERHVKRTVVLILGYLFLVAGIAGFVLPILQGWLFTIVGLLLLKNSADWAHSLSERIKHSHPKIEPIYCRAEGFVDRVMTKIGLGIQSSEDCR